MEEEDYILDAVNFMICDAKDVKRVMGVMDGSPVERRSREAMLAKR